jgi:AcrR family transcriptional regulator
VHDAVLDLLHNHELDKLSVSDVASRAGVHETSIYRRWGSRENLLIDALLSVTGVHLPVPDTGSLRADLIAYASSLAAYLTTPLGNALNRAVASSADGPETGRARAQYWESRYQLAREMITRAIDRGELPDTADPRFVLELLVAPLHFKVLLTREPLDPALPSRLVDAILSGIARA